jgi:hypothetical protein
VTRQPTIRLPSPVYSAHTARFHVLTNPAQDATGTGIGE